MKFITSDIRLGTTMELLKIASVVLMVIGTVNAYSDGAPENVCKSMDPSKGHGAVPQTSESWYYIKVNSDYYQPGQQLEVQIMLKKTGQFFEGFMIEARRVDPDENCGEKVGTFEERNETQLICGGQTVTHTSADTKKNLTFIWNAPQTSSGNIQFRATLVKYMKVFWVNVVSKVIYDKSNGKKLKNSPKTFVECPVSSTISNIISKPTAALPPTSKLESDDECGDTIGCFHDCKEDGSCNFIFSWKDVGQLMEMNMRMAFSDNNQNKWAAAGFSDDNIMGDDSCVECISFDGKIIASQSYNNGRRNTKIKNAKSKITLLASSFKDGVMECKMTREKTGQGDKDVYDLTKDWKVMVTYGASAPGYRKTPHDNSLTWITENSVDFQKAVDVANVPVTYPLVKAHACLMVIAWLATAATGLLTARYMKPFWASNTIQGMKVWFWLHRTSMILTLVLTTVGFVLIFIQAKGYSEISGPFYQKAHPILGIIVTILVYVNAIMSNFRTPPGTPYRPLFNFGHFFVGTGSYILAILTVFSGVELKKLKLPIENYYILIIYCVLIFCGYSMTEMIPKLPEKKEEKGENIEMGEPTTSDYAVLKKPKTREHQKKFVLVIHLLATWAITIALLYFIITN